MLRSKAHQLLAAAFIAIASNAMGQAPVPAASGAKQPVFTPGEFRSSSQDSQGRHYAHIKIAPGRKLPFTTLTYRVLDPALIADVKPGAAVEFLAQRRDGENVLTAIRAAH